MKLVSNEEFKKRLKKRYTTTHISDKSYYKATASLPKKLKHNSFDGGEYATTYMSSRSNFR